MCMQYPRKAENGVRSLPAGVIGNYELVDMSVGNWTPALWGSSQSSYLLSLISLPVRQVVVISRTVMIATFERLLSDNDRVAESMMKTVLPAKMNYHWPPADQEGEAL